MLHEPIFLATCNCNATNVALQVAGKNSHVTPHFATAIIALRVARKVERPSTFCNVAGLACNIPWVKCNALLSEWANQRSSFARLARPPSCLILFALQVAKTCDTPSATWKVFYSSSLRCNLQEKLLRATWPLVGAQREQRRAKKYGRNARERSTSPLFISALAFFRAICLN